MVKMSNGKLQAITEKYKQGGFTAIRDDIETFTHTMIIFQQTDFTLTLCKRAFETLNTLFNNANQRRMDSADYAEAAEINDCLFSTLEASVTALNSAIEESTSKLEALRKQIMNDLR